MKRASTGTLAAKRRTKNITGNLMTLDMERADVLSVLHLGTLHLGLYW